VTTVGVVVHTGKTLGKGPDDLRENLATAGVNDPLWCEVTKSKKAPKHVRRLLEAGVERLLVWGGDGTVRRCIDTIVAEEAKVELAILPAGTANLLATALGIPRDLHQAVDIAVNGSPQPIDVGVVNGEAFAVMAGTGFDAMMIRETDTATKQRFGRLSYVRAGARHVGMTGARVKVGVDGEPWFEGPAACVLVGNVGRILGGVTVFPDARFDDGLLDIGVLTARSLVDWLRVGVRAVFGRADASPFVHMTQGTAMTLRLDRKMPWQLDGGAKSPTKSLQIAVLPSRVPILVAGT
jgi:diacylglycerol kinase (ATP)